MIGSFGVGHWIGSGGEVMAVMEEIRGAAASVRSMVGGTVGKHRCDVDDFIGCEDGEDVDGGGDGIVVDSDDGSGQYNDDENDIDDANNDNGGKMGSTRRTNRRNSSTSFLILHGLEFDNVIGKIKLSIGIGHRRRDGKTFVRLILFIQQCQE